MLHSHPALVQKSYWNPGWSCQVVINYCGSRGSVQTDLHELRGLSSGISFQDLGSGATKLSTKGMDPIPFSSACHPSATATQRSTQAQRCCFCWKARGQQGNGPVQAAWPWNGASQAKITSLFACQTLSTIQLCWRRAWLSSASKDEGKRTVRAAGCGREQRLLLSLTFVAGAQATSYPTKWQDVA